MCYSALVAQQRQDLEKDGFEAIWQTEAFDSYAKAVAQDPKRFPPLAPRIFPGHYAAVTFAAEGDGRIEPMRYSAYPPSHIPHPERYTTFNARRDNLGSAFWAQGFRQHHGFVVLQGFYEWVAVKDLLAAGVVELAAVKAEFERQALERKTRILAQGKKWKPTPTEQKDPRFRRIVIEFKPAPGGNLLVPVIFTEGVLEDGTVDLGFAIVTDDPPPEVAAAGHDRCPVVLDQAGIAAWLAPAGKSAEELDAILGRQARPSFEHTLAIAA